MSHPDGYEIDPKSGCWIWQRGTNFENGYGRIIVGGETRYAHRVFFERTHGPIPDGFQLDHLCRNPRCVNSDHLEAVPPGVNTQRGQKAKMTPALVREMRQLHGTMPLLDLAARFGLSKRATVAIITRESWKNVD